MTPSHAGKRQSLIGPFGDSVVVVVGLVVVGGSVVVVVGGSVVVVVGGSVVVVVGRLLVVVGGSAGVCSAAVVSGAVGSGVGVEG